MLMVSRKGLGFTPITPREIMDNFGFRLTYVLFETPVLNVIERATKGYSKSEIRRKIKQGACYIGEDKITDPEELISSGNVGCFIFMGKEPVGMIMPATVSEGAI
jgi:hypothetical protein